MRGNEIAWRLLDLHRTMPLQFEIVAAEFHLAGSKAGALRRLEALGLVARVPDERDRRVRQIILAEQGERTRRALTTRVLATSPALTGLDDEGQNTLLAVLRDNAAITAQ